ncbi:MAG TPA: thiamine phosphate synthase [Myxococcota bacterium]|nr:thiamine phosphate synthase [Myxococcota bacterium]
MSPSSSGARFRLYLITDPRPDLEARVRAALAGAPRGAVGVQLRDKGADGRTLWQTAVALRALTAAAGATLWVNERADVARAAGADGVHLPADAMGAAAVRAMWPDALVGRSTHGADAATAAAAEGCTLVTAGPVFDTPSKTGLGAPLGLAGLAAVRVALDAASRAPGATRPALFALGGLDASRARACRDAGADGVACIRAVLDAPDPGAAVAALLAAFGAHDPSRP